LKVIPPYKIVVVRTYILIFSTHWPPRDCERIRTAPTEKLQGLKVCCSQKILPAESGPFASFHSVAFACTWAAFLRMSRTHLTHLMTIHSGKSVPTLRPCLSQLHLRRMPHCLSITSNCGDCCPDEPHECTSPTIFLTHDPHRKVANSKRCVIRDKILTFPCFWPTTTI